MTLVPESLALRYGRETKRNLRLKARAIPGYPTLVSRLQGLTAPLTSRGDGARGTKASPSAQKVLMQVSRKRLL